MQIPLNEFEQYISETILSRGLSYFNNGRVHDPELLSQGEYEFIIEGTENYTVQISLHNGIINDYVCDCPYDRGPICKHVTAAFFYLQQDELKLIKKTKPSKNKAPKKRKTIADKVSELLEQATHEDLKAFIKKKTEQDRDFRNMFLASFAYLNSSESIQLYKNQVIAILQASTDKHGFIDWSATRLVGVMVGHLLETAQKQIETKNYQSTFFICTAVTEELFDALQFADDSNGDIGGSIDSGFDILYQLSQLNIDESLRKQMIDYCITMCEKATYKGWDWHIEIIRIAAQLVKTDEETTRIFDQIEKSENSEYEVMEIQAIRYDVLLKTKGEAIADQYLHQHINNYKLRRIALQKALEKKEYEIANKLAHDGIAYDKDDKPGIAKEWNDWLLIIAQKQSNTEKIIEYARYLLIENYNNKQDYYQVLKAHVQPIKWNSFLEQIIEDIAKKNGWLDNYLIAQIFIKEKNWNRLMEMIRQNPDLRNIENYEEYLSKDYANDIIKMYANGIMKYLEVNVGRKHYQTACRYLRRMKKLGGTEQVKTITAELRKKYPRRSSLMEELNSV
jgi:hypothetical protein